MKNLAIVGRIGQEPEVRNAGGTSVLNVSVACDYQKKTREGGYERATQWVTCVVFGKRAESLVKVLTKGMRIATSGDFQLREYTDKNGATRVSVEVIANDIEPLFDKKEGGESRTRGGSQADQQRGFDDDSDNIPF